MKQNISNLVKKYRKKRGMTQEKLAEGICTQAIISKIEKGQTNLSVDIFSELCKKLEISSKDILQILELDGIEEGDENVFIKEYRQLYYDRDYKSIKFFLKHLINYEELSEVDKVYYEWLTAVVVFYYDKDQEQGLNSLLKIYYSLEKNGEQVKLLDRITQSLADMNYQMQQYEDALRLYKDILNNVLFSDSLEFKAICLHGISEVYRNLGDYDNASKYASIEIDTLLENSSLYNLGEAFLLLSDLLYVQNIMSESKENCQKAVDIGNITNDNKLKNQAISIMKKIEAVE